MAIFLVMFGAHINIKSMIKAKIHVLIQWPYRSQLCCSFSLELDSSIL
jgi:hypothetical protein